MKRMPLAPVGILVVAVIALAVLAGCATSNDKSNAESRANVGSVVSVAPSLPAWRGVKGAVGVVRSERSELVLDLCWSTAVDKNQKFDLCILSEKKVVRLASAAVREMKGQTCALRLDIRNVPDEDGDLIVVEDDKAVRMFRENPLRYVVEHEVFAVRAQFHTAL